jgi:mannose-6-phosphate isomerase-like protein (cupin superfamily)
MSTSGRSQLRSTDDTQFPKLPAPARRALSGAGFTRLDQLTQVSESSLSKLHGIGPTAIKALRAALDRRGLAFKTADVTHAGIDELKPVPGFLDGFTFRRVGAELGVTPFGLSIIDMPPQTTAYPEHDHSSEGPGNPPAHQLGQEEVYIALRGSADVEVDGRRYPIDAGHLIRVGPTARRKILPGPDGVRLLAIGGFPGKAYDPAAMI